MQDTQKINLCISNNIKVHLRPTNHVEQYITLGLRAYFVNIKTAY